MITRYEGKKSSLDTVLIEMKFGSPCEEHAYFTLFNKNATLASLGLPGRGSEIERSATY